MTETDVVYIPAVPGRPVVLLFYSTGVGGIEVRYGRHKIFSSGEVRKPYVSDFSAEVAGGWYNLTWKAASSDAAEFVAYDAESGQPIKRYKTLVIGNVMPHISCILYHVYVKYIYSSLLVLVHFRDDIGSLV